MNTFISDRINTSNMLHDVFLHLAKERIIFLTEEIDSETASTIAASMLWLNSLDQEAPISIYINCLGGSISGLFLIYDIMNMIQCPIKTYALGECASAASVILAAGTKGYRYAFPNSSIMIHEISCTDVNGKSTDIENEVKNIKNTNRNLIETLARHTGQSYRKVLKDCKIDKYMTASEAIEYGIVDKILEPNKKIPELIKIVKVKKSKLDSIESK